MLVSERKGQHTGSVVVGFYIAVVWWVLIFYFSYY